MRHLFLISFFCILFFASNAQSFETFEHDGLERSYILYQPNGIAADAPLVFMLHGYTGHAMYAMDYSEFNQLADIHKFVVCYPLGTTDHYGEHFWDVGYDFHFQNIDDIGFLTSLATYLQDEYSLSKTNTFCTGFSNGGDMSFRIACDANETFKAVAPVAGALMKIVHDDCFESTPVPIFVTNGTADQITLYDGDITNVDGWGAYYDIPYSFQFFNDKNDCSNETIDTLENLNVSDGSFVITEKWDQCKTGNQGWLYKIVGDGHTWPGYDGNQDIHLSSHIWEFFTQHMDNPSTSVLDEQKEDFSVYPNPAKNEVYLVNSNISFQCNIISLDGRPVKSIVCNPGTQKIDISDLPAGMYYIKTKDQTSKLIKI